MPSNLGTIDINILDMQQMKDLFQASFDLLQKKDKEIQTLKETVERKEEEIKIKNKTIVDLIQIMDTRVKHIQKLEYQIKESKNGL